MYNRKTDKTNKFNDIKHNKNLLNGSYGRHGLYRPLGRDNSGKVSGGQIMGVWGTTLILGVAGGALGHEAGKAWKYTEKIDNHIDVYNVTDNSTGVPHNVSVPAAYAEASVINYAPANASDAHGKIQFLYRVTNGVNKSFEELINATIKNTPYMNNNESKIIMEQKISSADGKSGPMGNITYSMKVLESNGSHAKVLLKERFTANGLKETVNKIYIVTLNESELVIRDKRTGEKTILPRAGSTLDYLVFKDPKTNDTKELPLGNVLNEMENLTHASAREKDHSTLCTALGAVAGAALGLISSGLVVSTYNGYMDKKKNEDLEDLAAKPFKDDAEFVSVEEGSGSNEPAEEDGPVEVKPAGTQTLEEVVDVLKKLDADIKYRNATSGAVEVKPAGTPNLDVQSLAPAAVAETPYEPKFSFVEEIGTTGLEEKDGGKARGLRYSKVLYGTREPTAEEVSAKRSERKRVRNNAKHIIKQKLCDEEGDIEAGIISLAGEVPEAVKKKSGKPKSKRE